MSKFRSLANRLAKSSRMQAVLKGAAGAARRRAKRTTKATAKTIRYVMEKNKEVKRVGLYSGVSNYNAAASIVGDIVRIIPDISVGDGDSNRDGREISLKKMTLKGCVAIQNGYSSAKLYVDIWLVEDKWQKNFLNVDAADAFLVLTNNSFIPVNPGSSTFWEEVGFGLNRDRFTITRKRIPLTMFTNTSTALVDQTTSAMRTFSFTKTWKRGRTLRFQSDADVLPSNMNTYMFYSVGSYDPTYYGTLSSTSVTASVNSMFYFTEK